MGNTHPIDSTSGISRGEDAQRDSYHEVRAPILFLLTYIVHLNEQYI